MMNYTKQLCSFALSLLILFSSTSLFSQEFIPTEIKISDRITVVEGKQYFIHIIEKGQTLYSLSKAYKVETDVVTQTNPIIKDGFKAGLTILIPVTNINSDLIGNKASQPQTGTSNQTTRAAQKETSITQQEGVSNQGREIANQREDITNQRENNTNQKEGVSNQKEGIPNQREESTIQQQGSVTVNNSDKNYKKHTVKWYESIDDIALRYGVSIDAIVDLNKLEDTRLKRRQVLLIPDKNYVISSNSLGKSGRITYDRESRKEEETYGVSQNDRALYGTNRPRTYIASVILPINSNAGRDQASVSYLDFYSGMLLALENLNKTSQTPMTINIVDQSRYNSVRDMIRSGVLDNSEIIIGPVRANDIYEMIPFINENKIPLVSPMDYQAQEYLKLSPFLFQMPTSPQIQQRAVIEKLVRNNNYSNLIFIYETGSENVPLVTDSKYILDNSSIPYKTLSYSILEGREIFEKNQDLLAVGTNNVLIASENEAFVSDVLRNLNLQNTNPLYTIYIYGFSRWRSFNTMDLSYLHLMRLRVAVPYYINYSDQKTERFVEKFQEYFNYDPSAFAFQGYDIATYFFTLLNKHGRSFPLFVENSSMKLLQSNISLKRVDSNSGFENRATRNLGYNYNWTIDIEN